MRLAVVGSSGFQAPMTVKEIVKNIDARRYVLPYIQREFVWEEDQMRLLWDSLMRRYTIGSFLFWSVEKKTIETYRFYDFIRDFNEQHGYHNPQANVKGLDSVTAILDGQQRFTTLYIGLKGTIATKIPWKRWDSPEAFPKRKLFLNLKGYAENDGGDLDMRYDFQFLTPEDSATADDDHFWFEVGKILDFEGINDINQYLKKHKLASEEIASELLSGLFEVTSISKMVNYYLETSQDLEKVLKIFIRTNSLASPLKYSDILLSIASAQWKSRDAREEIIDFVDELNDVGQGFDFDKDLVMKSCLVLSGLDVKFKVSNFNLENTRKIERNWDDIQSALRLTVRLASRFGYSDETLASNNALIPVAYYIKRIGNPKKFTLSEDYKEDRSAVRKWLTRSLIKRTFSGTSDTTLAQVRRVIRKSVKHSPGFPFGKLVSAFRGTSKSIVFTVDDIESLLAEEYPGGYTFTILSLLYPNLDYHNQFHIDHIHPKSFFKAKKLEDLGVPEKDRDFCIENFNRLPNLQLMEGVPNEEKSSKDFGDWILETFPVKKQRKDFMDRNYIPELSDDSIVSFREFYKARSHLLRNKLTEILVT